MTDHVKNIKEALTRINETNQVFFIAMLDFAAACNPVAITALLGELEAKTEALEEIALAGMSGSGQESEEAMRDWHARQAWKFIGIAARALDPVPSIKGATP